MPASAASSGSAALKSAIAAGTTSAAIPITIVDDADAEGTEQFQVRITAAPGAKIVQGTIVVQIVDDDQRHRAAEGDGHRVAR